MNHFNLFKLIRTHLSLQLYSDCLSSLVHTNLSNAIHLSASVFGLVFWNFDDDAATVWCLGNTWFGWANVFMHDFTEEWSIDQKVFVRRWISVAMRCHHYIVHVHLLHRSTSKEEVEQTYLQWHSRYSRQCQINCHSSGTGTWRFTAHIHDAYDFHLLSTLLFAAHHFQYIRWQTRVSMGQYDCVGTRVGIECRQSIHIRGQ